MPVVKIEIMKGRPKEYKSTIFECIYEALDIAISVPRERITLKLTENDETCFVPSPERTSQFILIEIILLPGRDAVLKKSAIEEITRLLGEKLGIVPNDILIIFFDPSKENWGHKGLPATHW